MEHEKSRLLTNVFLKAVAVLLAVICFVTCFVTASLTVTSFKSNVYNDGGTKLLEDSIAGRTESIFYGFSHSLWNGSYEYVTEKTVEEPEKPDDSEVELSDESDDQKWKSEYGTTVEPLPTLKLAEPKRLVSEQLEERLPKSVRPENSEYVFVMRDADGEIVYTSDNLALEEIEKDYEILAHEQPLTLSVQDPVPVEIRRRCRSLTEAIELLGAYRHFTGTIFCVYEFNGSYLAQYEAVLKDGELDMSAYTNDGKTAEEFFRNDAYISSQDSISNLVVSSFVDRVREDINNGSIVLLDTEYEDFLEEYSEPLPVETVNEGEEAEEYQAWLKERYKVNLQTLDELYCDYYDELCERPECEKYISYIQRYPHITRTHPMLYQVLTDNGTTLSYDLVGSYYAYPEQDFTVDMYFSLNPTRGDSLQYTINATNFIADNARLFPIIMLVSALLLMLLLFYIALAAGERRGHETAVACWFDMIPLELFVAADIVAAVILIQDYLTLVYDCVFTNYSTFRLVELAILAAVPFAAGLVGVLSLMTLSTRIKAHIVLKYSFVGVGLWLIKCIWRYTKRLFKAVGYIISKIPLVWQCVAAILLLALTELILVQAMIDGAEIALLLWLAMWAAVALLALCWCIGFKRVQKYAQGIKNGDISKEIDKRYLFGALKRHAEDLEGVDEGIKKAVDERMKSERFKTELIANVSHDLKTPLTSIVNYVDILSKDEIEPPEAREHIDVLKRQAARMKKLIEDLVEVSKASSGTISANMERTDVNLLVTQTATEYAERFENCKLELVMNMPEKKQIAELDGRLMWRVLDNICNNICKYALAGTRVYITAEDLGENVRVSFRNISRYCLNMTGEELMERFVRGDTSRNTEGSGLGLSIAKSFCDLQKVGFDIVVDGDLFKVSLMIPKAPGIEPDDSDAAEQEAVFRAGQRAHTVEEEPDSEEILPIREVRFAPQNEPIMIPEMPDGNAEAEPNTPKTAENDENPALFDEKEGE